MTTQRYVSPELTHFVGKNSTEDEQYSVLVNSILKSGWLKHDPTNSNPEELLKSGAIGYETQPRNDTDAMFAQVVCFCDIPVTDLQIHMNKYSRFGLSFLKPFLVNKGANPVMYVADNSPGMAFSLPLFEHDPDLSKKLWSRRKIFETSWQVLQELGNMSPGRDYNRDYFDHMLSMQYFLSSFVFSFVKYFDDSTSDEDPANVYMEREWRVLGDVSFTLSDVHRVFMPHRYAERFRAGLPNYIGQLTFSDSI